MSWKLASKNVDGNDPAVKKLFDEAMAAAPTEYTKESRSEDPIIMLPRKPLFGRCRLCGLDKNLTKEHIPPAASGNLERHKVFKFDDWLKDKMDDNPEAKHAIEQGGIFGYTLCRSCNSFTGIKYGTEYKRWVDLAKKVIDGFGTGMIPRLDSELGPFGEDVTFGSKADGSVKPGAFVRQVLSCMCSLSGEWDLAGLHPVFRRIILEQSTEALPEGIELTMFLYFGPRVRIQGPQLRVDTKTGIWRWIQELAFPPFAFQLIVASNTKEPGVGLLIDNFTTLAPTVEQYFSGIVEMGFGWSPYPGDYRSRARIEDERKNP